MGTTAKLSFLAFLGMTAMPAYSADFPATALLSIGFTEVSLSDLEKAPTYKQRARIAGGYLGVSADLNGDGEADEVRILQNRDRQIAYVVAVISSPDKLDTYVLSSFALSELPYIAIDAVKTPPQLTSRHSLTGIATFDLRTGKGENAFFDGEGFNVRTPLERPIAIGG